MSDPTTADLIARLESAEKPTRGLFGKAFMAAWPKPRRGGTDGGVEYAAWWQRRDRFACMLEAEAWESAAVMLVPDGYGGSLAWVSAHSQAQAQIWSSGNPFENATSSIGVAVHPALALAAAALRARGVA